MGIAPISGIMPYILVRLAQDRQRVTGQALDAAPSSELHHLPPARLGGGEFYASGDYNEGYLLDALEKRDLFA